jgi:hypothetical protein
VKRIATCTDQRSIVPETDALLFANCDQAFFNSLLSCSLSRGGAQFFTPPPRTAPIIGAHSRRQDFKTPVKQALMRGLGTA